MNEKENLLTENQIAELTGIRPATLRKYRCHKQGFPYLKILGNVRYKPSEVQKYLDTCTVQPSERSIKIKSDNLSEYK